MSKKPDPIPFRDEPKVLAAHRVALGRYDMEAFVHVIEAMGLATMQCGTKPKISASFLLAWVAKHAADQFGLAAHAVLREWGVRKSSDVGDIVYALVETDWFTTEKGDSRADFVADELDKTFPAMVDVANDQRLEKVR